MAYPHRIGEAVDGKIFVFKGAGIAKLGVWVPSRTRVGYVAKLDLEIVFSKEGFNTRLRGVCFFGHGREGMRGKGERKRFVLLGLSMLSFCNSQETLSIVKLLKPLALIVERCAQEFIGGVLSQQAINSLI